VLLDFQVNLPANGNAVYQLSAKAQPARPAENLTWKMVEGVAGIDTGVARFRIDTRHFRLFDSVRVGGVELIAASDQDAGAILEDENKARHLGSRAAAVAELEDAGPMRVVLALRGEIGPKVGNLPLAQYVCRMHFYAGKSEVRVFFTLHNPGAHNHPGNIWDLGSGGSVFMEDFSLVLPLLNQQRWAYRIAVADDQPLVRGVATKPVKLYQDSSGGENWRSANHIDKDYQVRTSFRGYRVYDGEKQLTDGHRADGWLHVRGKRGGVRSPAGRLVAGRVRWGARIAGGRAEDTRDAVRLPRKRDPGRGRRAAAEGLPSAFVCDARSRGRPGHSNLLAYSAPEPQAL
jgi:hypothetical protein